MTTILSNILLLECCLLLSMIYRYEKNTPSWYLHESWYGDDLKKWMKNQKIKMILLGFIIFNTIIFLGILN